MDELLFRGALAHNIDDALEFEASGIALPIELRSSIYMQWCLWASASPGNEDTSGDISLSIDTTSHQSVLNYKSFVRHLMLVLAVR